jgi:hypothetical protein
MHAFCIQRTISAHYAAFVLLTVVIGRRSMLGLCANGSTRYWINNYYYCNEVLDQLHIVDGERYI